MLRWLLTLAAAAALGLAGATAGQARTANPDAIGPQATDTQVAQADKPAAKTATKTKKSTRKRTRKAKRRSRYGQIYLTAYSRTGRRVKVGRYGSRLRLYTKASKPRKTRKGKRRASRTQAVKYCGKTYYTTKVGTRWVAAHKKVRHVLVVRKHTARRKFRSICGKPPKRVKRRTVKRKTTKKKS